MINNKSNYGKMWLEKKTNNKLATITEIELATKNQHGNIKFRKKLKLLQVN